MVLLAKRTLKERDDPTETFVPLGGECRTIREPIPAGARPSRDGAFGPAIQSFYLRDAFRN